MKPTLVAFFLLATTLFAQDPAMLRHFDYDQKAALEIQEAGVERRGQAAIHVLDVRPRTPVPSLRDSVGYADTPDLRPGLSCFAAARLERR